MSSRNLFIAAIIACMTGALFGYAVGFIGGILVLPSFEHHFALDLLPPEDVASENSKIVSSWLIGCVIGVPLSVPVCSKYGRKLCMVFSACLYVLGAIMQLIPFEGLILFQLGRFLNGIGVGVGTLVSPIYISEISPADLRGALMSGYQVAIQVFALMGFWSAFLANSIFPNTSDLQWQIPVMIQLFPGTVLMVGGLFLLPESPRWLIRNGNVEPGSKVLSWLRMKDQDSDEVLTEVNDIQQAHEVSKRNEAMAPKESFFKQTLHQPLRKRMLVGIGLMIAQNAVGLNAINYYAPQIFNSAGFTSVSSSLFLTGLFGLVKLITALLFMFIFVRQRGNRFWLLLGSAIMAGSMFVLAYCVSQLQRAGAEVTTLTVKGVISVLMVYLFAFAFGVSLGPISWNVCAEIFPSHINTQACAVTTCVQWIFQIVIASITPPLITSIGWGTYIVYGGLCVISFVWCAFTVPETRGVPLGAAMDRVFGQTPKYESVPTIEEVEHVDETTPLIPRNRRRSSIAIVV